MPDALSAGAALSPVPFVPEVRLYQADESTGLWDATGGEYHSDRPPPFWAFTWAGGLALARYVLDRPETVVGRCVLDIASGSGLVAIAAALAGAASVRAVDVSPDAVTAARRNARANGVTITATVGDILDSGRHDSVRHDRPDRDGIDDAGRPADVVLAGDAFYTEAVAGRILRFLRHAGRDGARVLVGDPDRGFLPHRLFRRLHGYDVPTRPTLEGVPVKHTTIWELCDPRAAARR